MVPRAGVVHSTGTASGQKLQGSAGVMPGGAQAGDRECPKGVSRETSMCWGGPWRAERAGRVPECGRVCRGPDPQAGRPPCKWAFYRGSTSAPAQIKPEYLAVC